MRPVLHAALIQYIGLKLFQAYQLSARQDNNKPVAFQPIK